jgi:long-chain acyl-CoA synthetase
MGFFGDRIRKPHDSTPALFDDGRWYTYGELYGEIAKWAARFHPGELILSFCRNDLASVVVYLGALDAGAPIALLPDNLAAEFQDQLIRAYDPEHVFHAAGGPVGDQLESRPTAARGAVHPRLALLLSTSGTTGNPKFVRSSIENVRANACSIAEALGISAASRAIASLPMHYSYGLSVINSHLVSGASIVLTNEGLMSGDFWKLVREQECDSFAGVPYSYQILDRLNLDRLNVPSIRVLTQAGGKLGSELILKFHETMSRRGGRFFTMYGQTEATARISVLPPEMLPAKAGSVGFAIPGGSIQIGESGEVTYTGPNVMMGYAENRAELALGDTQSGTLSTGDLGYIDQDGCLWITGRIKREAKLFGLRVNLDDLESLVRVHGPAAAIANSSAGGAERLNIYCEFDEALFPGCRQELAAKLRVHHAAFVFHRVDRLPVTSAGKIDYRALESAASESTRGNR